MLEAWAPTLLKTSAKSYFAALNPKLPSLTSLKLRRTFDLRPLGSVIAGISGTNRQWDMGYTCTHTFCRL